MAMLTMRVGDKVLVVLIDIVSTSAIIVVYWQIHVVHNDIPPVLPPNTPRIMLLPRPFLLWLILKRAFKRLQPRMPIIMPDIRPAHPTLTRKRRSTMHDPPIINHDHRPRPQLDPILGVGALDGFFPLGSGLVPCLDVFGAPTFAEDAAVLVVPSDLDQFARHGVMLEYRLGEWAKEGALGT